MKSKDRIVLAALLFVVVVAFLDVSCCCPPRVNNYPAAIYGRDSLDQAYGLVQAPARHPGYCMAGWTRSHQPSTSNPAALVVKTDPKGIPEWGLVSEGRLSEEAYSLARLDLSDSGYAIAGISMTKGPSDYVADGFVARIASKGTFLWAKTFGGPKPDTAYSVVGTPDGCFMIAGVTYSFGPPPYPNAFVLKIDSLADVKWGYTYHASDHYGGDGAYSIAFSPYHNIDTTYVVVGRTFTRAEKYGIFVLQLDEDGNVKWARSAPEIPGDACARAVAADSLGQIHVAGTYQSPKGVDGPQKDIVALKLEQNGTEIWCRSLGWLKGDEEVLGDRAVAVDTFYGTAICARTSSVGSGGNDFLVLSLDPQGNLSWCITHPSQAGPAKKNSDVARAVVRKRDGSYAIAGYTNSYLIPAEDNFLLLTLDKAGKRPKCVETQQLPSQELTTVQFKMQKDTVFVPTLEDLEFKPFEVYHEKICE